MKGIQIRKEDIKPSLFADDMFLYIENPEDTTKKLFFSKDEAYKINIKMQGCLGGSVS